MNTYIVTDLHLGHAKMVEYCGRPIDHSERILEALKDIPEDDTLICLGDICIGKDSEWHTKLMDSLRGVKKILIKGNHDHKTNKWYLEHGWDEVHLELTGEYCGAKITFSHRPIQGIKNINIHGHMHNNEHRMDDETKKWYDKSIYKLLAIENTNYKPVVLCDWLNSV